MRINDKRTYSFTLLNYSGEDATVFLADTAGKTVDSFTVTTGTELIKEVPIGLTAFCYSSTGLAPTAMINGATAEVGQTMGQAFYGNYLVHPHPSVGDIVEMSFTNS